MHEPLDWDEELAYDRAMAVPVTEPLDLDALRREFWHQDPRYYHGVIHKLIAELEATRASQDAVREQRNEWRERAERAEAELDRVADDYAGLIVRCKRAEATIARVEAELRPEPCRVTDGDRYRYCPVCATEHRIRAALGGDHA